MCNFFLENSVMCCVKLYIMSVNIVLIDCIFNLNIKLYIENNKTFFNLIYILLITSLAGLFISN